MNAKSFLIALIVVIVVLGAGGLWWISSGNVPLKQPATDTQQNGFSDYTNTTGVSTGSGGTGSSGQTQQTISVPDLVQAYSRLYAQLLAQPIQFAPLTATTSGSLAGIYPLYADDISQNKKFFPKSNTTLLAAAVDLTEDGIPEAVVYENLAYACGSGGCQLDVYQKKGSGWTKLISLQSGEYVGVSNTFTTGYRDLFIARGQSGGYTGVGRYVWNGTGYQFKEMVAIWTGQDFKLETAL